jgi:hypothetical protein
MRTLFALLATLLLAACASTPAPVAAPAVGTKVWYSLDDRVGLTPEERDRLVEVLEQGLAPVRVAPGTAGAQHLRVTVVSYRMVDDSARAVVGMVSGSDHIASVVQHVDPAGNRVLAEKRILTRASKSIGAADALLRAHGTEITGYVLGTD